MQVYDLTPNKRHLELTIEHISTLSLAYFFSGNEAYGVRAREKAVAWFLDPETAMQAQYAGRLAGVRRGGTRFGRPEGAYDMRGLPELLNGVTLLASTPVWSEQDTSVMARCAPTAPSCLRLCARSLEYPESASEYLVSVAWRSPDPYLCEHTCQQRENT